MNPSEILILAALGAVFGVFGQSIRVIVGLRKRNARKKADDKTTPDFSWSVLSISLFMGGIAGVLAVFITTNMTAPTSDEGTKDLLMGIMAAGYAGADFIEGAVGKLGLG